MVSTGRSRRGSRGSSAAGSAFDAEFERFRTRRLSNVEASPPTPYCSMSTLLTERTACLRSDALLSCRGWERAPTHRRPRISRRRRLRELPTVLRLGAKIRIVVRPFQRGSDVQQKRSHNARLLKLKRFGRP